MAYSNLAYSANARLNVWIKLQTNQPLTLADVPSIIPLRWIYLRDNWETLREGIVASSDSYPEPDFLLSNVDEFDLFIKTQRNAIVNPLQKDNQFFRFHGVFSSIQITDISLSKEEETILDNLTRDVTAYTKKDFLGIRDDLVFARDRQADIIGGGDETYNTAFNRASIPDLEQPTVGSVNEMLILHQQVGAVDLILANIYSLDTFNIDPFALAKQNASNPAFNIAQFTTGTLDRLNTGESLQQLAKRSMGDPDKWLEIAIANGLKPPYIDDIGFKMSLISNATGNQINIAAEDTSGPNKDLLYVNQIVEIRNNSSSVERRTIVDITEIPISGDLIIELDGDDTLSIFKTADGAYLRVFKPNTVNSTMYVLIPSTDPLPEASVEQDIPWFLQTSGEDEKRSGVDILLDSDNDISFGSNSDINLSYGVSNAIQGLELMMVTEQGELSRHSEFGLANVVGLNSVDEDSNIDVLSASIKTMVTADQRFDRLESIEVQYKIDAVGGGPGYQVNMTVRLAGSLNVLPISFTIAKA